MIHRLIWVGIESILSHVSVNNQFVSVRSHHCPILPQCSGYLFPDVLVSVLCGQVYCDITPTNPFPCPWSLGSPCLASSNTELRVLVLSLSEFSLLYISRWIIRVCTSSNQDVSQVAHSAVLLFAACLETDYLLHLHSCRPQHLKTQTFNVENEKMLKYSETIVFVLCILK